jgi:hypothetical protein
MPFFIELTHVEGYPVFINIHHIDGFFRDAATHARGENTTIFTIDRDDPWRVVQTPEEIFAKMPAGMR